MIKTTESIYIDAPVEKVFDFYKDVANWSEIAPVWLKAAYKDVKTTPELTGTSFSYEAKMAGVVKLEGTVEILDVVRNQRIVMRDTGRVGANPETLTFLFEPVDSGMALTVVDERDATRIERVPLVGRLAKRVVDLLSTQWMHVLKRKMEQDG